MKARRLALFGLAALTVTLALAVASFACWQGKQAPFDHSPDLFAAVRAFAHDQAGRGPLPPEISLQDLIKGGYLDSNDVRTLKGFEVTFSTRYDNDDPQLILARAVAPDGHYICLLADGSVQQLSTQKYRQQIANSVQNAGK